MAISEEMAHTDEKQFFQVIAPTLSTGAAFIGITTISPDGDLNFVNRLVATKNKNGEPIFRVINVKMVCDECEANGVAMQCKHRMGMLPFWQSSKRHDDIEAMMGGEASTFLVEMRGISDDPYMKAAFDPPAVAWLRTDEATVTLDREQLTPNHIFVCIDPAAGGKGSDYAIVTTIFDRGRMIIVGAEANEFRRPQDAVAVLIAHIIEVRRLRGFESATAVLIPESNMGFEGMWIEQEVLRSRLADCCVMEEDDNRAGVRQTNATKTDMAHALDLHLRDNKVLFLKEMVCLNQKITSSDMRAKLIDQLESYSKIAIPSNQQHGETKFIYSGKQGSGHDDLAIAIQMCPMMQKRFFNDTVKYGEHH